MDYVFYIWHNLLIESTMKKYLNISSNRLFGIALILVLIVNIFASYSENALFLNISKLLFVPVFLASFLIKDKVLSLVFLSFLMFSFVGDLFPSIFGGEAIAANVMYLVSYICLLAIAVSNFRLEAIDKVVGAYLLVVLLINGYFLYTVCSFLNVLIVDEMEMLLFGAKSWALMLLAFTSFAVYLGKQNQASILFLIMSISFVFSDILNYVNHYYIYNWSILMLERVLHAVAIFYAFKYMIEQNKIPAESYLKRSAKQEKDVFIGDNILA